MASRFCMVAFVLFAVSSNAFAKVNKADDAKIGRGQFVAVSEVVLTPEQFAQYPLPEYHCAPEVTIQLPSPLHLSIPVRVVHVNQDIAYRLYSWTKTALIHVEVETNDGVYAQYLIKEIALWWGGESRDIENTATNRPVESLHGEIIVQPPEKVSFHVVVTALERFYSKKGETSVKVRCMDLPAWIVRSYPFTFDSVKVK